MYKLYYSNTILTASNPLEHILLIAIAHDVSGIPPKRAAILTYKTCVMINKITPAPDYKTLPTTTSSILDGSILVCSRIFLNNGASIASHGVSLNPKKVILDFTSFFRFSKCSSYSSTNHNIIREFFLLRRSRMSIALIQLS
jgi:hypothetical protein